MNKIFKDHLSSEINEHIVSISPVSGGDINHAACINTELNNYFIKWNDISNASKMFQSEANALLSIAKTQTVAIPNIVRCSTFKNTAYLILEYVVESINPSSESLYHFGRQLANLHKVSADYFGYETGNFIGSLDQLNIQCKAWDEFYIINRLQPQYELAKKQNHLSSISQKTIANFYREISVLLKNMNPSLLHGDLWSGNFIIAENSTAYLIDPASYYGHHEVDLAMSELFGSFGSSFYSGYHDNFKISKEYPLRKDIYQLYYLLVHLNLFGKSYEDGCIQILSKFD